MCRAGQFGFTLFVLTNYPRQIASTLREFILSAAVGLSIDERIGVVN